MFERPVAAKPSVPLGNMAPVVRDPAASCCAEAVTLQSLLDKNFGFEVRACPMRRLGLLFAGTLILGCNQNADKKTDNGKANNGKAETSATTEAGKKMEPPAPAGIPAPPDVAAPPADATKTASGLAYKRLKAGTGGPSPTENAEVEVHYTGWTTDGKMFDSSVKRGRPAKFKLKAVIPGWTEGLQLMANGDRFRFWIPEELAYKGRPGAPQGMLVFDVELLRYKEGPKPIPAPSDVAAPPKDAKKTASGLAYKAIKKGKGRGKPTATSVVKVHYTGWTTDGKMFDSSIQRGQPAQFPLNGVIKGWTEGLQLMTTGDTFRFWIPEELAYQGRPGAPKGMLVFDVELLEFK